MLLDEQIDQINAALENPPLLPEEERIKLEIQLQNLTEMLKDTKSSLEKGKKKN